MKIVHWAIIFVIIILPFSIICRTTIQKKTLVLQDQTRINNVLDNATFDAVGQILEMSEVLGYGKNIPITRAVAEASINRFFQTMAVNFNLPATPDVAKEYFGKYIPVILIVGYDGLYIYSYDLVEGEGYQYVLKPKIPYTYTDPETNTVINFTLGNDIKLYMSNNLTGNKIFLNGTLTSSIDTTSLEYGAIEAMVQGRTKLDRQKYIEKNIPLLTSNLSLIFKLMEQKGNPASIPQFLRSSDAIQDYEYNSENKVIVEASEFHKLRRDTIINLITNVLQDEVNEHETYADLIGVNYNFYIPTIDKEQWQNSINDISVLAFFQGMPIGTDSFYNNYSLGGARIVKIHYLYGNTIAGKDLYHKYDCPKLLGENNILDDSDYDSIFANVKDANINGYYACEECR